MRALPAALCLLSLLACLEHASVGAEGKQVATGGAIYKTSHVDVRHRDFETAVGKSNSLSQYKVASIYWPKHSGNSGPTQDSYYKGIQLRCDYGNGFVQIITTDSTRAVFAPKNSLGWRYPLFLLIHGKSLAKPCSQETSKQYVGPNRKHNCIEGSNLPPAFALADILSSLDTEGSDDYWSVSVLLGSRERLTRENTPSTDTKKARIPLDTWRFRDINLIGGEEGLTFCKVVSLQEKLEYVLSKSTTKSESGLRSIASAAVLPNRLFALAARKLNDLYLLEKSYGVFQRGKFGCNFDEQLDPVKANKEGINEKLLEVLHPYKSGETSRGKSTAKVGKATPLLLQVSSHYPGPGPPTAPLGGTITKFLTLTKAEVKMSNEVVGQVGQSLSDSIFQNSGPAASVVAASAITSGLPRLLVKHLADNLIAALSETLVDSTEDSLAFLMTEELTKLLTPYLSEHLVTALNDDAVIRVPEIVDRNVPDLITASLTRTLAPTLTRSLAHSIVPTLVHTLTHSPLQDFYCYYCYNHKAYCQYCHYAPQQLYYAMYYAGFYSAYYTSYYTSWSEQRLRYQDHKVEWATRRRDQLGAAPNSVK